MFLACYLRNSHSCRDSTITSSQYHCGCRCGPNGLPSNRLDGQLWRAEVSVSGGRGVRTGWCQMRPEPNQGPPDLSMGRVSAAGPSPDLRSSVWVVEGRSGCPGWRGRQKRVVLNAAAPTKGPQTFPWVV